MIGKNQLAADAINGVYVSDVPGSIDHPAVGVLIDDDFYNALEELNVGITLHGIVSDEIAAKIESEYGIR